MIAIVCGGRNFQCKDTVFRGLDWAMEQFGITEIVHGGAQGVDTRASWWASIRRVPYKVYPANWEAHGKTAGPIRNRQILEQSGAEMVLAFPGRAGTADMVRQARQAGLPVYEFKY